MRLKGLILEITGRKSAEERQRALMAELDDRVKNVLARVAAVVMFTRKGSYSTDECRPNTRRAHSIDGERRLALSQSRGREVGFADLSETSFRYATDANTTISG